MTIALSALAPARDRCLPVDEAVAGLFPDAGLRRGRVVGCAGPVAMSLALGIVARSIVAGSWLAVVGVPALNVEAAGELGVPLSRIVRIAVDPSPREWGERIVAAADGFDVVMTRPPPGAERVERTVRNRLQAKGVVLLAVGPDAVGMGCDLEITTTSLSWVGPGAGNGHLTARRARVRAAGRRAPRPVELDLWLPGPDGRIALAAPVDAGADPIDRHDRIELVRAG